MVMLVMDNTKKSRLASWGWKPWIAQTARSEAKALLGG